MKNSTVRIKKNLAIFHDSPGYGGIEVLVASFLRNLDRQLYNPIVIIPGYYNQPSLKPFIDEIKNQKINLKITPYNNYAPRINFIKDVINLSTILRKNRIDILHIHTRAAYQGRRVTLAAGLSGIHTVLRTEHSSASIKITSTTKYEIKPFDWLTNYIVTVSNSDRIQQLELLDRKAEKVVCCYNGIELNRFNPDYDIEKCKEALYLEPKIPVVGLVGRLDQQKGHIYLIEAAAQIIKEFGPVKFLFVGDGELEEQLKQKITDRNLVEFFVFAGFKRDPTPYIKAMDMVVFPSLYESFPLAVLEYMALAKPIVISDIACTKELVVDNQSALIIPVKDPNAIAVAVLKLLYNKTLAKNLGNEALKTVHSKFSIERNIKETLRLYNVNN